MLRNNNLYKVIRKIFPFLKALKKFKEPLTLVINYQRVDRSINCKTFMNEI